MPAPLTFFENVKLTGRTRHRHQRISGLLVLQVEVEVRTLRCGVPTGVGTRWRDATVLDLQALGAAAPVA